MNSSIFVQAYAKDGIIDGEKLANDIQIVIQSLNNNGYKIISITSIISGAYFEKNPTWKLIDKANYAVGYSYTEGVIILAELI